MFEAFLWGLLATSSLVLGALVVRVRTPGELMLGVIMVFGAGVLISVVAFELIEEAVAFLGRQRRHRGGLVRWRRGLLRRRHCDLQVGL